MPTKFVACILYRYPDIWCWKHCDLEIWVKDHSRSLKMVPFESYGMVSNSHCNNCGRIFSRFYKMDDRQIDSKAALCSLARLSARQKTNCTITVTYSEWQIHYKRWYITHTARRPNVNLVQNKLQCHLLSFLAVFVPMCNACTSPLTCQ